MKIFGGASALRGSAAWTRPFRLRVSVPAVATPEPEQPAPPAIQEFDEAGRLYVFRYAPVAAQQYRIERDRIFEYVKRRALPDEGQRQFRRDARNRADFFADVREIQTPSDVQQA